MPSRSVSSRRSSWSDIEPAAAEEPKSERPKRAPSSSAQLTSRTVTGGVPSSAIRRSTSTAATTFRHPSSQPPFGTESMWPPISTARSESPRSVHHWLPAASTSYSSGRPSSFDAEPVLRLRPGRRPRHALSPVLVARELAELAQLRDGAAGVERHRGDSNSRTRSVVRNTDGDCRVTVTARRFPPRDASRRR